MAMTLDQAVTFAIIAVMMTLLVWGRLRYDLVALLALLAAVALGVVPPERAFSGFGDDVVVIVACALVVSAAIARSGITEVLLQPLMRHLTTATRQVLVLVSIVTVLSAFVKNVGALAILMPIALQLARRTGTSPACLLMPLAFGSLLGGVMTMVGTSPNIIVSRLRADLLGQPFGMFDFTPVGAALALAGVIFLAVGFRLLPSARQGTPSMEVAFTLGSYTMEAHLPAGSPLIGKTVADFEALVEDEVRITTIVRERFRRYTPAAHWVLCEDDVLLLDGEPAALERVLARGHIRLNARGEDAQELAPEDRRVMEAVVMAPSPLVDHSPAQLGLRERYGLNLLAIGRSGERITRRLRSVKLRPGDVVVVQGAAALMPDALGELRCLPLAERRLGLEDDRSRYLPALLLAAAMALAALEVVPVAIALLGASVVLLLTRMLTLREAYDAIEWPILILLGALIPVSEAVRTTGGTELLAGWLAAAAAALPPLGAVALTLAAAMAVTPFLNNAATVLVMAPVAASLAQQLGLSPDPFLMAVAIGAACDFLTPIGHQCNTLVMGPGGYRFSDYPRLGLPLSVIVLAIGVPLIALVWPLAPG